MERKILEANEGMILTNEEIFGTKIYLGEGVDERAFKEITREEYENIMEEEEKKNE